MRRHMWTWPYAVARRAAPRNRRWRPSPTPRSPPACWTRWTGDRSLRQRADELVLGHRRAAGDALLAGLGVQLSLRALLVRRLAGCGRLAEVLPAGLRHLDAVLLGGLLDAAERFVAFG